MPNDSLGTEPSPDSSAFSRRCLLSAGTVGAFSLLTTACSDETSTPDPATPPGEDDPDAIPGADLTLATTALSMETLAVTTYDTAVQAMEEGRLGAVPPALDTLVTTIRTHHVAHREAWSELVGEDEAPTPSPVLDSMEMRFTQQAAELVDPPSLARLAVTVEEIMADTYFLVIPSLTAEAVLSLAATIQPLDSQHAAIARFLLGEYPVPETFSTGAQAFGQSA